MNQEVARSSLLVLVICLFSGCGGGPEGPPRAAVKGNVMYDGQPLAKGTIVFAPIEQTVGPKVSSSITDGVFEIDDDVGPVVGRHRVEIRSADDGGYAMNDEEGLERLKNEKKRRIQVVKLPPVYNETSKLVATINADEDNVLEFKLTPKGD